MSLTTVNVDVRDDWIGARNTELDGLMIRGDEFTIRGCELLSPSGCPPPSYGRPLTLYSSLWTILVLHLLVIHAYTWVHVPSATPSNVLWVAITQIALSRGHVHINGVRMLTVGIYCGGDNLSWKPLHYTPMAVSLHLHFPLGRFGRLPLVACRFLLPWSQFAENRIVLDNVS